MQRETIRLRVTGNKRLLMHCGRLADPLDPRTAVAVGGELADGGAEDLLPGSVCVPLCTAHRGQNTGMRV